MQVHLASLTLRLHIRLVQLDASLTLRLHIRLVHLRLDAILTPRLLRLGHLDATMTLQDYKYVSSTLIQPYSTRQPFRALA